MVGVPRLRHRARTTNASRWRQELVDGAGSIIAMFRGIISENAPALLEEADRRFADFNGSSTEISTQGSTLDQGDINDTSQSTIHDRTRAPARSEDADASEFPSVWLDRVEREEAEAIGTTLGRFITDWQDDTEEHFRATGERF